MNRAFGNEKIFFKHLSARDGPFFISHTYNESTTNLYKYSITLRSESYLVSDDPPSYE